MSRRDRIRVGGYTSEGQSYLVVALGKDVPDELVTALEEWAARHGAEPSHEYYVGTLEHSIDAAAHARGDFVARGDLDVYRSDMARREQAAKEQFQPGWKLANPSQDAWVEARRIAEMQEDED